MSASTAEISIANDFDGDAIVTLFHTSDHFGAQRAQWRVAPGETAGSLAAMFRPGLFAGDRWTVMVLVTNGSHAGLYVNAGGAAGGKGALSRLEAADTDVAFRVGPDRFELLRGASDAMTRLTPAAPKPVSHVFVVMLENRSFDHVLAFSGITGLHAATTADFNMVGDTKYPVTKGAPLRMSTDPGHEFCDVLEQVTGQPSDQPGSPPTPSKHPKAPPLETCQVPNYPPITNSGFAQCYATGFSEYPYQRPDPARVGDIMACFDTAAQLPVTYAIATQSSVCDHWHASLPGPTWPNRFFVHGASSSGLDDSPVDHDNAVWEFWKGFRYKKGSIYDRLAEHSIPYRFYHDSDLLGYSLFSDDPQLGSPLGCIPQVGSLHGVSILDFHGLDRFAADLQQPYPYPYTFIEPNYGDFNTYAGGSSQHPMDDVYGGERLLAAVVEAIQQSPWWQSSVLIVCYDEHGGFYDSVLAPDAIPPGDCPDYGLNQHQFDFSKLGVRVPAMIVSPLADAGVDHTTYDHASVCKFVEELWGLAPLTDRDGAANSPLSRLRDTPRDLHIDLPHPLPPASRPALDRADRPLPRSGNVVGSLAVVRKTEAELAARFPAAMAQAAAARPHTLETFGDAEAYAADVLAKVRLAKQLTAK